MSQPLPIGQSIKETDTQVKTNSFPTRVVQVHAQTRQGLLLACAFVIAAVLSQVFLKSNSWWFSLHLFVVGALLTAISTVTQMLAVTWSTSRAPSKLIANIQRWALASGAIAIVWGRQIDNRRVFEMGAALVLIAMLILIFILISIRSKAQTKRFSPAIEAYVAAIVLGTIGMSIGTILGNGYFSHKGYELRQVHLALNLYGLIGLIIAGTLPYFAATQVRSKMSKRATPKTMRTLFSILFISTLISSLGFFFGKNYIAGLGLFFYALGLIGIVAILPIYSKSKIQWAGPRILQIASGIFWWAALSGALAIVTIVGADDRVVLEALIVGGFAQILIGSLAYLGPVLLGGGHENLTKGFLITRSYLSLLLGNLAGIAIVLNQHYLGLILLVAWLLDVFIRGLLLIRIKRRITHV